MSHLLLLIRTALASATVLSALVAGACERLPLRSPAPGAQLSEAQPELRWSGASGQAYRVQVAVVLPEARLLQAYDEVVTAPAWRLPQAVASTRAAIKVLVSRGCAGLDTQDLAAQGPAFFIDLGGACGLPMSAFAWRDRRLLWPGVPGASHYRLRVFELSQWSPGEPVATAPDADAVSEPEWPWPDARDAPPPPGPRMLVWQAVCGGRAGEPVVLDPPAP